MSTRRWQDVPLIDAAAPVPATALECLAELAGVLAELDRRRAAALKMRDELVVGERARGTSWDVLAGVSGTSRQALMKRGPHMS